MKKKLPLIFCIAASLFTFSCSKDNRVEVSFSWNYDTENVSPDSIKVSPGKPYGSLPEPGFERDGFTFGGWNLRKDGKADNITSETIVAEDAIDHTLYAKWIGEQYTVSYDLHGGNINGATTLASTTVTCGNIYGAMVIPSDPQKKLGTFLGWYLNAEGTGERITYSTRVTLTEDHTLHAVYKETKLNYSFDNEDDKNDFVDVNGALEIKVQNSRLEIKNTSEEPRAYMAFNSQLRAGTCVKIDAEFVGTANAEENVRAGMYVYGLNSEGYGISGGFLPSPEISSTREEIKNWYYGQGANNVQAWELAKWNNGHIVLNMNILEDCYGVYFMFDFGRKTNEDGEIDMNPDLWQNNLWVINLINIDYADYESIKDEVKFDTEEDLETFGHPKNVEYSYDAEDKSLKVTKGSSDEKSYLEFETHYLKAGSRVDFEVTYYGEDTYSPSNLVGIYSYGNYPNGKILTGKVNENGRDTEILDSDPQQVKDFYWGGYGATNESWAPVKLANGRKVSFTNYVYEDCYGITLWFKFGNSNGYFKINSVKVHRDIALSEFDFSKERQLEYFKPSNSTSVELDGDQKGDFLKVTKTGTETNFAVLKTLLKAGQKVTISLSYVTDDPTFVNGSNQFTFLMHKANLNGEASGGPLSLIGSAPWDGGWDSNEYILTATMDKDCYGVWMQFVFNKVENSYFRISYVVVE